MAEYVTSADVQAALFNTDAIASEIRNFLFIGLLLLAGAMFALIWKGNSRAAVIRLGIAALAVLVVGIAGNFLLNVDKSQKVTDQIVNVDGGGDKKGK